MKRRWDFVKTALIVGVMAVLMYVPAAYGADGSTTRGQSCI